MLGEIDSLYGRSMATDILVQKFQAVGAGDLADGVRETADRAAAKAHSAVQVTPLGFQGQGGQKAPRQIGIDKADLDKVADEVNDVLGARAANGTGHQSSSGGWNRSPRGAEDAQRA